MLALAKTGADTLHRLIARNRIASKAYLQAVGWVCRNILPASFVPHVVNMAVGRGTKWPPLEFGPRIVRVGMTRLRVHPHIGEFDQQALFYRQMKYEEAVFQWLSTRIGRYDTIIEIGANVGIYTIYLGLIAGDRSVYAFEPSFQAFSRLLQNLQANATAKVNVCNVAIGRQTGFVSFFEPEGHLTNGSFLKSFSEQFSRNVREVKVPTFDAKALEPLMVGRVLIKIDVEGYEPALLDAMASTLERLTPDLLIEVLPGTEQYLNQSGLLSFYEAFILDEQGAHKRAEVNADPSHRDWILIRKACAEASVVKGEAP